MLPRITDLGLASATDFVTRAGHPAFRGGQLFDWIHGRSVTDPDLMTNIPKALRAELRSAFDVRPVSVRFERDAGSDTEKALVRFTDKKSVESVLIMEGPRTTVCLSSQVGCPVACGFCASGVLGLDRNLSIGEILDQFHALRSRALEHGRRIGNVVMMGMGEPMLNLSAVLESLEIIHHEKGGGIGARHLTISTVGLSKGIDRLRKEGRKFTLAFSLHASNDDLRRKLIPFEGALSIDGLVDAARGYLADTGREVTFEYVLLRGVNSLREHAQELAHRLAGVQCSLNVIPYNVNPGLPFERPTLEETDRFVELLRRGRLKVTVRKRKGNQILAACGQLRLRDTEGQESSRSGPEATTDPVA